jgi:F0F1-type ATP synthase beta subunit
MTTKFGRITQVIGAVVDVQFEGQLPELSHSKAVNISGS